MAQLIDHDGGMWAVEDGQRLDQLRVRVSEQPTNRPAPVVSQHMHLGGGAAALDVANQAHSVLHDQSDVIATDASWLGRAVVSTLLHSQSGQQLHQDRRQRLATDLVRHHQLEPRTVRVEDGVDEPPPEPRTFGVAVQKQKDFAPGGVLCCRPGERDIKRNTWLNLHCGVADWCSWCWQGVAAGGRQGYGHKTRCQHPAVVRG